MLVSIPLSSDFCTFGQLALLEGTFVVKPWLNVDFLVAQLGDCGHHHRVKGTRGQSTKRLQNATLKGSSSQWHSKGTVQQRGLFPALESQVESTWRISRPHRALSCYPWPLQVRPAQDALDGRNR
eukprot:691899-Amphidinium_carterae.1